MSDRGDTVVAALVADGFTPLEHHPTRPDLHVGARVRLASARYPSAMDHGTATVLSVLRKGSDDAPDWWEQRWGRPNIEVVVEKDPRDGSDATAGHWADYATEVVDVGPLERLATVHVGCGGQSATPSITPPQEVS